MSYQVDSDGQALDTSMHDYTLTFAPGTLPPVNAFWSLTMYDGRMGAVLRMYLPRPEALNGDWKAPPVMIGGGR